MNGKFYVPKGHLLNASPKAQHEVSALLGCI